MAVGKFAVESWLITPAAGVASTPPPPIQDQQWLLVLNGVAAIDHKGARASDWTKDVVSINPSLEAALRHAITRHRMPTPPGNKFSLAFEVDLVAPFGTLSSVMNEGPSVHAGYAVDSWRPNLFGTGIDALSNAKLTRLFRGIELDVGVRDKEAIVHRVSYTITLLGKIAFPKGSLIP